jgi:DNA-binding PadR family transcriptional regulator
MCARRGDFDWASAWSGWCGPGFAMGFGPGTRRRGRRGRFFDRGDLKYVILRLLERKPMHGYEVMQALEEEAGGWYSASAGSVYPVLQLLQDQGYVTSREEEGRRVYSITEEGRAFLDRHTDRADDVMDRVSNFADRFSGREMEDLTRSFMRLARVSFDRAMEAMGDPDELARVREILDRAIRDMQSETRSRTGGENG